mmetsp:Transcript_8205/g.16604  ORF Transcript_8205/g.16604 Transcript_8205/m.16604 type:complete len:161 (-) Transcript_8205:443-925(-)
MEKVHGFGFVSSSFRVTKLYPIRELDLLGSFSSVCYHRRGRQSSVGVVVVYASGGGLWDWLLGKSDGSKDEKGGEGLSSGGRLSGLSEDAQWVVPEPDPNCTVCGGSGYVDCGVCRGTGKDKVHGNPLERWTCARCKGAGYVGCSCIGQAGLTPEQRGER